MNDTYIITAYVVIDDMLKAYGFEDDSRAIGSAAEILTVGIMAAKYFQNHHERALVMMTRLGYVHGLSVSRFNRRLHAFWEKTPTTTPRIIAHRRSKHITFFMMKPLLCASI